MMAGGGVRAGQAYGSTDDVGLHAVEDRLHVHDSDAIVVGWKSVPGNRAGASRQQAASRDPACSTGVTPHLFGDTNVLSRLPHDSPEPGIGRGW